MVILRFSFITLLFLASYLSGSANGDSTLRYLNGGLGVFSATSMSHLKLGLGWQKGALGCEVGINGVLGNGYEIKNSFPSRLGIFGNLRYQSKRLGANTILGLNLGIKTFHLKAFMPINLSKRFVFDEIPLIERSFLVYSAGLDLKIKLHQNLYGTYSLSAGFLTDHRHNLPSNSQYNQFWTGFNVVNEFGLLIPIQNRK